MPSIARSLPLVTQQAMTSPPSHFYSSLAGFPTPSYPDWMMFVNIFYTPPSLIDALLRSNQSILKEISPGCSLEGMMLKLKLQYFGHLKQRVDSLEKTLMLWGIGARGEGDDRGWDGWMASPTRWTWVWVNSRRCWWTGRPGVLRFMGSQRVGHDWATELNWTDKEWSKQANFVNVLNPK